MTRGTQEAPGPGGLLTEHEQYASAQAGLLYGYIAENIIGHGPTREADLAELIAPVHQIQRMIGAQAAARGYPGTYRLLGDVVPLAEHRPPPSLPSPARPGPSAPAGTAATSPSHP